MAENDFKQIVVNREFLAEIFNCEVRTVQNYAKLYGMPRDERGEYPLFDCLIWFIRKVQKDYDELSKDNPLTRARIEAIELNNQKKKIEMEKAAGALVPVEQVKLAFTTVIKSLMRNLESIPPRLNKKINGDSVTLATIREEIYDFRMLCANTPVPELVEEINQKLNAENKFETNMNENLFD